MSETDEEQEKVEARTYTAGNRITDGVGQHKFPEVRGLCRTCSNAHITRRQYREVPTVICTVVFDKQYRVPLDIVECTGYDRRGEMGLREMQDLALVIDTRKKGGQYL